jgi:hypothetical protein
MPDQVNRMTEPKEIREIAVEHELHACPDCTYALGFHTSFLKAGADMDSPVRSTRDVFRVILICPECGARFDIGWRVSLVGSGSRIVRTAAAASTCVPHGNPADCLPARQSRDQKRQE